MPPDVFNLLPQSLKNILQRLPSGVLASLEEIRVRESRPLEIVFRDGCAFVSPAGACLPSPGQAYAATRDDCANLLDLLTNHSVYSFEEELKRGYITVTGGHRVGLAGRAVLEQGRIRVIRDIASFNIRIAKEIRGAAAGTLPLLVDAEASTLHHTLILSPPQQGKTTLIRDLARMVSAGEWVQGAAGGRKVGIVDERSEIAACFKGVPRFDVGPRTDVLDGCPKAEGMMLMIRSMSPEVLAADEIGKPEDAEAVLEALHAGIRVVVTAHGADLQDAERRPALQELIRQRFFGRYVILRRSPGGIPQVRVLDRQGQPLPAGPMPAGRR